MPTRHRTHQYRFRPISITSGELRFGHQGPNDGLRSRAPIRVRKHLRQGIVMDSDRVSAAAVASGLTDGAPCSLSGDAVFTRLVSTLVFSRNRLGELPSRLRDSRGLRYWRSLVDGHLQLVDFLVCCEQDSDTDSRRFHQVEQTLAPWRVWLDRQPETVPCGWRHMVRNLARIEDTVVLPLAALRLTLEQWQILAPLVDNYSHWLQQESASYWRHQQGDATDG